MVGYGILYPMWPALSGNTKGILGWTQMKEYNEGVAEVEAVRAEFEEKITGMTADADPGGSRADPVHRGLRQGAVRRQLCGLPWQRRSGQSGFSGARRRRLAVRRERGQDHRDHPDRPQGCDDRPQGHPVRGRGRYLANWVVEKSEGQKGSDEGWNLYNTKGCSACHGQEADGVLARGPNGEVLATVGAANLTDGIWRFEPGGVESAKHTIMYGVNQPGVEGSRDAGDAGVRPDRKARRAGD